MFSCFVVAFRHPVIIPDIRHLINFHHTVRPVRKVCVVHVSSLDRSSVYNKPNGGRAARGPLTPTLEPRYLPLGNCSSKPQRASANTPDRVIQHYANNGHHTALSCRAGVSRRLPPFVRPPQLFLGILEALIPSLRNFDIRLLSRWHDCASSRCSHGSFRSRDEEHDALSTAQA